MSLVVPALSCSLEAALKQYREQGFAPLGPVLTGEGLQTLRERAVALMRGEVSYPGMFFQMDAPTGRYEDAPLGLGWQGPSDRYRKLEKLELDDRFRALIGNPLFEQVARALIPDPPISLYRAILFNKGEGGGSDIPWHQDGGKLWGLSAEPHLQLWVALDDAPVGGGCLEFLPGSHLGGLATPLGGVVPADQVARAGAEERAVAMPVKAGEALLLHNHVWHRSGRSAGGQRRIGFSACYLGSAIRCVRKKKAPRQFFRVWESVSGRR